MYDITAFGELLIDFTEYGVSEGGNRLFEQNPGGAVCNVLCAAAPMGMKTAFIGKVGRDMHGEFLKKTLDENGVCTKGLVLSPEVFTTLAFVAIKPGGDRVFSFARKPGADTCFEAKELNADILSNTRVLHVGSLSLTHEPSRYSTYEAVRIAKEHGALISYDPNYRASLWGSVAEAEHFMRSLVPVADVMKFSDEESVLLTGETGIGRALAAVEKQGVVIAAATLGKDGCAVRYRGETMVVPGHNVRCVDATGAGDAFWGGFLARFLSYGKAPSGLTMGQVVSCAEYGNATAACCVMGRGAIPAMPKPESVIKMLAAGK
ncbi:MAG: carbohydrate kinase [Oscillospiraceae bacterium]